MQQAFPLPSKFTAVPGDRPHSAVIQIEPLYPGYGTTIGNALRRALLSSLEGAAITSVKIEGVNHEFSTIPMVKEDVVSVLLNLKSLRFTVHGDEPVILELKVKGERAATGKDFKGSSNAEVMNGDQVIAMLTDKAATLEMEITVEKGLGYLPVESREKEKLAIGQIAVDAIFTPVKNVNYEVEHVRVGQRTDFDRLIVSIVTDGSITPEEALKRATMILSDHFTFILTPPEDEKPDTTDKEETAATDNEAGEAAEKPKKASKKSANA